MSNNIQWSVANLISGSPNGRDCGLISGSPKGRGGDLVSGSPSGGRGLWKEPWGGTWGGTCTGSVCGGGLPRAIGMLPLLSQLKHPDVTSFLDGGRA